MEYKKKQTKHETWTVSRRILCKFFKKIILLLAYKGFLMCFSDSEILIIFPCFEVENSTSRYRF